MKTSNLIHLLVVALMASIISTGCRKDNSTNPAPASATTGETVLTPFGQVDKSKVHFIADGYKLSVVNGRLQKLESKTGKLVEDFGIVQPNDARFNLRNAGRFSGNGINGGGVSINGVGGTGAAEPGISGGGKPGISGGGKPAATVSGWIADANWTNTNTSDPITYFTTNWTVPSTPANQSSQTIFLFNGMQDGLTSTSYIIQPVLQWGGSAAGGGKYWSITSWYVSSSQVFYGSLTTVSPGTNLQGVMSESSGSGSSYTYLSYFAGYSPVLEIEGIPEPYWCAVNTGILWSD